MAKTGPLLLFLLIGALVVVGILLAVGVIPPFWKKEEPLTPEIQPPEIQPPEIQPPEESGFHTISWTGDPAIDTLAAFPVGTVIVLYHTLTQNYVMANANSFELTLTPGKEALVESQFVVHAGTRPGTVRLKSILKSEPDQGYLRVYRDSAGKLFIDANGQGKTSGDLQVAASPAFQDSLVIYGVDALQGIPPMPFLAFNDQGRVQGDTSDNPQSAFRVKLLS